MSPLSQILRTKLIPWAQEETAGRFIVVRPKMHEAQMPGGVKLSHRKISGKRVVVKNQRNYSNIRNIIAVWPEEGLQEINKYTLICVLEGYIDYQLGHYRIQCGPGHFIFIPPGIPYPKGVRTYVDLQKGNSCEIVTFLLHPNALECWMSHGHSRGREIDNYCLVLHDRVVSVLKMLMQEVVGNEESTPSINRMLLAAFIAMFQREIDAGRFQRVPEYKPYSSVDADSKQTDFVTRLQQYIKSNLRQKLTLDVVAREMYLSPTQFARVVRRETGMSFVEFLTAYRMEEAKKLLRDSPWTAAMIGKYVGFKSPSYFRTFFKRYTGQSPTDFRKENSKKNS